MICFSKLGAEGLAAPFDMTLRAGLSAAVITPHELENETVIRLILGFQQPLEGSVTVGGLCPQDLKEAQLSTFRRDIGIIYSDGGMLSNLNVWENLTLQLAYFSGYGSDEIENRGREALQLAGYDGPLGSLPDRLTLFQRRLVGFARIFLAGPVCVIYQSLLDGLSHSEQKHLTQLARDYHHQGSERTTLYLTSYPDSLTGITLDFIYNRGGAAQP